MNLVLSLFPGIGLLDMAFEQEGFCVVRGPDVLWGGDIRNFHPPAGKFDGVIGGPPCQFASAGRWISNTISKPINFIPEFERCIAETQPSWFVMENTRRAPIPSVPGYVVWSRLIDNRWFGAEQGRVRRFTCGAKTPMALLIEPATFMAPRRKRTVLASDGKRNGKGVNLPDRDNTLSGQQFSIEESCELQGLPREFAAKLPFTKEAKYRVIGNGVPLPMGRAIAKAVKEAVA